MIFFNFQNKKKVMDKALHKIKFTDAKQIFNVEFELLKKTTRWLYSLKIEKRSKFSQPVFFKIEIVLENCLK